MSKLITVPFHGDTLFAVEREDGIHVAIKPIADRLGIDWRSQRSRLSRDPILSEGLAMEPMPSVGGAQDTVVLRLDLLSGWLFGLDASRVRPECREAVLAYQRECFSVLFAHFYRRRSEGGVMMTPPPAEPARAESVSVRRGLVTEARQTFGARAAGSLWFALGLPTVPEMSTPAADDLFTYTAVRRDGSTSATGGR
ncbi:phage antirepressor N-terminal domain-containing protein [Methylobacterium sp. ID0610]|uniref:phage antirepressor N-terminal domain-containing protein n=1 Tax=Methylobacterium carpenticola TaxID=3344827 RepID=UPI00367AD757